MTASFEHQAVPNPLVFPGTFICHVRMFICHVSAFWRILNSLHVLSWVIFWLVVLAVVKVLVDAKSTHWNLRAPFAKPQNANQACQSIWSVNWQGNNEPSNSRVYRLDFRITLTRGIGKALPIQRRQKIMWDERVIKAIYYGSAISCRCRWATRRLDLKPTHA